ncbi:MAG: ATP-binding cassette domain-containing protein [Phycisphaera sp.]|nr:ATP-binding cassette domain-containing protein [Phycisphaera sp.]
MDGLRTYFRTHEGEVRAVDGVSFKMKRGSILAIVGESGCGKSVTAYSILRLIQPPGKIVGGRVTLRPVGEEPIEITALGEKDERLYHVRGGLAAMIFQEPMSALSPVHTVGNQIMEAIFIHQKVTKQQAQQLAEEMLSKVGIPNAAVRLKQYPHELSGGMRQRVVIAMALVCRPQLLIADEPTTALDVTIQAQIMQLMKGLQSELGTGVMLITHDLGVVAQLAEEVAVMYLGRIVEKGSMRTIIKKPRHPYTMALLQSLPSLHARNQKLPSIKGSVPALTRIPSGCPFHPRCEHAQAGRCDVGGPPPLEQLDPDGVGHEVACLRVHEIGPTLKAQAPS